MNTTDAKEILRSSAFQAVCKELYDENDMKEQIQRYENLIEIYADTFGNDTIEIFSSPGRTEIIGNHTDHNNGKVIAASIDRDCIGIASKTNTDTIEIKSIGYNENIVIDLNDIENTGATDSVALIKGILSGFKEFGYKIGGFKACTSSKVTPAAGLSSSASFEMLICTILNNYYNGANIDTVTCCRIGKYAENTYWNKQSGMLDQMASGVGGLISIDFKDNEKPVIKQIDSQFIREKYDIIIVNTGKSHSDLNSEYSSIPIEMKKVAKSLKGAVCRDITIQDLTENFSMLREKVGDRALLRTLHYLAENQRVDHMIEAMHNKDYNAFLKIVSDSGNSSWKWLQNCYSISQVDEQGIPLALSLTEMFIEEKGEGACRVHGGGFAGVIMAILPKSISMEYTQYIGKYFGEENVFNIHIREYGPIELTSRLNIQ